MFDPCSAVFDSFEPVALSFVQEAVSQLKPSGSPIDPVPPHLFKEVFPTVGPYVHCFKNSSLSSGVVPVSFKHAVVQPLIKKPGLDPAVMTNFRPISKLSILSIILEKIVYCCLTQLMDFLNEHIVFQSDFKPLHSTESALLRVFNNIILPTDTGHCVILVDFTAAFDTVDHDILIAQLEQSVGIRSVALEWFMSYLSHHILCQPW